jgi:hypothetical protein
MGESAQLMVKEGTESRQRARAGVVIPYFQREAGLLTSCAGADDCSVILCSAPVTGG